MLPGWIVYEVAFPLETSITVWPRQIVLLSVAMFTIGKGFTVIVSMLKPVQVAVPSVVRTVFVADKL